MEYSFYLDTMLNSLLVLNDLKKYTSVYGQRTWRPTCNSWLFFLSQFIPDASEFVKLSLAF